MNILDKVLDKFFDFLDWVDLKFIEFKVYKNFFLSIFHIGGNIILLFL